MRLFQRNLLITILLISSKASLANVLVEDTSRGVCMQHALKRFEEAITLMQKHYYKKDAVNWDSMVSIARKRINSSASCNEAYETINWCFSQMSETHSFIMPAARAALYANDTNALKYKPNLRQIMGDLKSDRVRREIAYLNIPWISTSDPSLCTRIADSIQNMIATLDDSGTSKWIIDLRQNSGGNCWPMLAGLGPLLDEGTCAYFVTPSEKLPLRYKAGASMQGKYIRCKVSGDPYKTKKEKKWIVVLTGPKTSSSGEIVALAFKGKENVFLFGEPTAGLTTANATYPLSDKSMLVLTVCQEADRSGKICEGKIVPDVQISSSKNYAYDDPVKSAAVMWLEMQ